VSTALHDLRPGSAAPAITPTEFSVRWLHAVYTDLRLRLFPDADPSRPPLPGSGEWLRARTPRFVVQRHARKLARWLPDHNRVDDLEWRWLPGLQAERLAELVIREPLGQLAGVRHLFYVADEYPPPAPRIIWGLAAGPLAGPLGRAEYVTAWLRKRVVVDRFYADPFGGPETDS
jgi:hypothetical protein